MLFERSAKVRTFPVSEAAAFREFVDGQASAFLGAVDDWLEARIESSGRRVGSACTAGVFTFAFIDDIKSRPMQKRRSRSRSPTMTA